MKAAFLAGGTNGGLAAPKSEPCSQVPGETGVYHA